MTEESQRGSNPGAAGGIWGRTDTSSAFPCATASCKRCLTYTYYALQANSKTHLVNQPHPRGAGGKDPEGGSEGDQNGRGLLCFISAPPGTTLTDLDLQGHGDGLEATERLFSLGERKSSEILVPGSATTSWNNIMTFWQENFSFIKDVYESRTNKLMELMDKTEKAIASILADKIYTSNEFKKIKENFVVGTLLQCRPTSAVCVEHLVPKLGPFGAICGT